MNHVHRFRRFSFMLNCFIFFYHQQFWGGLVDSGGGQAPLAPPVPTPMIFSRDISSGITHSFPKIPPRIQTVQYSIKEKISPRKKSHIRKKFLLEIFFRDFPRNCLGVKFLKEIQYIFHISIYISSNFFRTSS